MNKQERDSNMEEKYKEILIKEVHEKPKFEKYKTTYYKNETNCYSHAIGATYPFSELYRIGAICGKKPLGERYFSEEEIKELLFLDFKTLNLKIEESSKEEELESPNQYKILLCLKLYREQIFDFHFWRSDDNKTWTEKWRFREMRTIRDFKMEFQYYGAWTPVGYYKVTR